MASASASLLVRLGGAALGAGAGVLTAQRRRSAVFAAEATPAPPPPPLPDFSVEPYPAEKFLDPHGFAKIPRSTWDDNWDRRGGSSVGSRCC